MMELLVSTGSMTATTKSMVTSLVMTPSSTKRSSSKIAKLQGYVVRGVTAANKPPALMDDGSFNTKRSALRLVRPTIAGRPAILSRTSLSSTTYSTTRSTDWAHQTDWTAGSSINQLFNTTNSYLNNVTSWPCPLTNLSLNSDGVRTCPTEDDDTNGTYGNGTILLPSGDDAEMESKNFWALLLFLFPLLTVFGNVLVILSVYRERALQTATNYFIISLAIADLLVATLVMPFAVYVTVNAKWDLLDVVCDFYIAMDVTCSTSSILNLVAISIDRYIAVTQPIKYARHKNHKRVWLTIGLVWAISAAIGLPIVLGLNNTDRRISTDCAFYNADFVIYSSLSSFYIPCIIMVFLYYQIFKGIRERAKRATANRKPQHAHLMDNLAPHTKRLAETAIGGPPIAGQQQNQSRTVMHSGPASISGTGTAVGAGSGTGGTLASSLLSSAPGVTLAKTTLLGRAASMTMNNKQNRRRSLFDEDKVTDQGSGSQSSSTGQDEDDEDEKYAEEQDGWCEEGSGLPRDNSTDYILTAKQQSDLANAGKVSSSSAIAATTVTAAAATIAGLSNGETNGNPSDTPHILGHPILMADGVPCLATKSGSQKNKGSKGKGNRSGGGGSSGGVDSTAETPPSGSGYAGGNGGNGGAGGSDKESKQYQTAGSRFTIYKVNKASRKKREKSSAKKERKATKTLAIVLGVFLICWVPFFTCNILDAICTKFERDCQPGGVAFHLTTWLGYVNSFINPVIYTIFNLEFRKAFKRILVCAD